MVTEYARRKEKYDNILFRVPKGKREEYQAVAQDLGIGFWALIQSAIDEFIQNHAGGDFLPVKPAPISKPESPKLSSEERRLLDEFNKLPPDVQKSIAKMIRAINAELERDKIIAGK